MTEFRLKKIPARTEAEVAKQTKKAPLTPKNKTRKNK
jgi:hypothetical protein